MQTEAARLLISGKKKVYSPFAHQTASHFPTVPLPSLVQLPSLKGATDRPSLRASLSKFQQE